jgi:[glutamine synthetase] adenylyltransferase / [glutamine synthetase]-adenylyl-L-tyrosine phosphorylase
MQVGAEYSRYVQRIRRRYAADLASLPGAAGTPLDAHAAGTPLDAHAAGTPLDARSAGTPAPLSFDTIRALVHQLRSGGRELASALRVARQLVLERLVVLDVEHAAPLSTITHSMTALAEATLEIALAQAEAEADARYGAPLDAAGRRVPLWIVGMGKLGARELNVSSDIDLVYVFDDGSVDDVHAETAGPKKVSLAEYFGFVAKRLYTLIGETTEDGFVFRVDLALRPNGNSGPPVVSLSMLEEYFQVQGREWERFAWLKSRVVAPRAAVTSGSAVALRALVTPFVYRRYLDYGVFEGLRQLHHKIREEAKRRGMGRPELGNDLKLSRGGIREIEFIVQLMMVVRGGQYPEIRTRSTLRGLERLAARGLMKPETAARLADGYTLLRRVEHRIQYLDDQQTHLLPTQDADLAWIAATLRLECPPGAPAGCCPLQMGLGEVRELVAAEFDALLREGAGAPAPNPSSPAYPAYPANEGPEGSRTCRTCGPQPLPIDSDALLDKLPAALAERTRALARTPRVATLRDGARLRLGRLVQKPARALEDGRCSEAGATRFVDWVEPLLRRESYLALLLERAEVHQRLLRLLGLARWPMRYLMRHPGVIDELADERLLHQRFDAAAFKAELQDRLAAWQRAGEDDEDKLLDTLRRAHHAEVFRTLVRDVEGRLTVEQVADDLSALADAVLDTALAWCWARLKQRHRSEPALAIVAYGKLGGKELGYGSDLDVVFVYDDGTEPDASDKGAALEIYGAFVRRLITWLTLRTAAGELFDIDTALRPNGNSGLLVTSISAFEAYQVGRGSNTAWTWEHQALTRARWAAGTPRLAARFEAVRRAVLTAPRDAAALRAEVLAMREKLRAARAVPAGRFDAKHSPGGMVDAEFAVQYLVLAHAAEHPALREDAGNIALLQRAEAAGLLPAGVGTAAADAYRELRRAQHGARLDEQPTHFDPIAWAAPRDAVLALWRAVFG